MPSTVAYTPAGVRVGRAALRARSGTVLRHVKCLMGMRSGVTSTQVVPHYGIEYRAVKQDREHDSRIVVQVQKAVDGKLTLVDTDPVLVGPDRTGGVTTRLDTRRDTCPDPATRLAGL